MNTHTRLFYYSNTHIDLQKHFKPQNAQNSQKKYSNNQLLIQIRSLKTILEKFSKSSHKSERSNQLCDTTCTFGVLNEQRDNIPL